MEIRHGDIVNLRSIPIDLNSDTGHQFVTDCTRAAEGLITDKELAKKCELSPADWQSITKDMALGRAIRAERERRVHNGTAAREAAAKHFVKAPGILDQIMTDAYSNPRHKIEAIRELRQTAIGDNTDRPTESDRFVIRIDLTAGGGGVETYSKAIKIDPTDEDSPNNLIPLEGKPMTTASQVSLHDILMVRKKNSSSPKRYEWAEIPSCNGCNCVSMRMQ